MNTQEVLNPKSWAERTFGGVQLHDIRRTRRAVQAESRACGEPFGFLACSHADLERDQSLVSFARTEPDVTKARLDAASPATEQGPSHFPPGGALDARYDWHRSVASSTSISGVGQIGNERGRRFFVQTVLAVRPQTREVLGCMAQEPFVRIPAPKARTAVRAAQARGARKRCVDAPGASHWHP
jgi:hypothetical protein